MYGEELGLAWNLKFNSRAHTEQVCREKSELEVQVVATKAGVIAAPHSKMLFPGR